MWIKAELFQELIQKQAQWEGVSRTLELQNRAMQTTQDWLRTRVTQLEKERAQLLFNYTGVKVPVPEIQPAYDHLSEHKFNEMPSFNDVGDIEAARLGIEWNAGGEIVYKRQ